MIKVVIIEDELEIREMNRLLLTDNFNEVKIVGEAGTVENAITVIRESKPDLVLFDIELADGNCFQALQQLKPYTFKIIFITAYSHHAIKAIKFNAVDYILKPVNEYEFINAIQQAIAHISVQCNEIQLDNFAHQYTYNIQPKKLALKTLDSIHFVSIKDVMYCKSDNSYTTFHLVSGEEIVVSRSIKEYEEQLKEYHFIRPHQSYLVNLEYISKIDKADGGFIILYNSKEIPISVRRKMTVIKQLERI